MISLKSEDRFMDSGPYKKLLLWPINRSVFIITWDRDGECRHTRTRVSNSRDSELRLEIIPFYYQSWGGSITLLTVLRKFRMTSPRSCILHQSLLIVTTTTIIIVTINNTRFRVLREHGDSNMRNPGKQLLTDPCIRVNIYTSTYMAVCVCPYVCVRCLRNMVYRGLFFVCRTLTSRVHHKWFGDHESEGRLS